MKINKNNTRVLNHVLEFLNIKPYRYSTTASYWDNTLCNRLWRVYYSQLPPFHTLDLSGFIYWVANLNPEELESEFTSHEIMELFLIDE